MELQANLGLVGVVLVQALFETAANLRRLANHVGSYSNVHVTTDTAT